jgi:hypothetical protein
MNSEYLNLLKSPLEGTKAKRRKTGGDVPIQLYIHTCIYVCTNVYSWKCHNETPCIGNLKKQKPYFKMKVKQGLSGNLYQWKKQKI